MSAEALYEATRGVWVLGDRRLQARHALAVFQGVVRQTYDIHTWHKAGTTPYRTRAPEDVKVTRRWEFLGAAAPALAEKYCGGSVESYLSRCARAPVVYVNC